VPVDPSPRKKVKVTTPIVWGVIPKVHGKVDTLRAYQFRASDIAAHLGCRGEQLATPMALLRRWGLIERMSKTGKWMRVTEFGKKQFGREPRAKV
jgi:hypothetical protein